MNGKDRMYWTEIIETYQSSGLTAIKWCQEQDIAVHRLRYRITQFNKEKEDKSTKIKWTSITPENIEEENLSTLLKVIIGKSTIEIAPGFDVDTFESIVRVLSKC